MLKLVHEQNWSSIIVEQNWQLRSAPQRTGIDRQAADLLLLPGFGHPRPESIGIDRSLSSYFFQPSSVDFLGDSVHTAADSCE
jgi:hypothetical protein